MMYWCTLSCLAILRKRFKMHFSLKVMWYHWNCFAAWRLLKALVAEKVAESVSSLPSLLSAAALRPAVVTCGS